MNVCTMSDLEAYYDRQIPELCGLMEETVRATKKAVKLITKVLTLMKNHAGTANRVSAKSYCGKKMLIGGIGQ